MSAGDIDLFLRTFLIKKLYEQSSFIEAASEADDALYKHALQAEFHQVDNADSISYLSRQTMANAIYMFRAFSAIRSADSELGRFKAAVRYFGIRDELASVRKLFHLESEDEEIISDIGGLAIEAANGSLGDEAKTLITATWIRREGDAKHAFIVLRAGHPTTLLVDLLDDESDGGGAGFPPTEPPVRSSGIGGGNGSGGHGNGRLPPDDGDGGFGGFHGDDVLSAAVLSADDATKAYREFIEHQLKSASTSDMLLYDVQQLGDELLVTVADPPNAAVSPGQQALANLRTVKLSEEQYMALVSDDPPGATKAVNDIVSNAHGAALVAYTNPFGLRNSSYRDELKKFTFSLQRAAQNTRVYHDPLSARTGTIVRTLSQQQLGAGSTYVAYLDDGSFKVTDYNIIQDIRKDLTKVGVHVVAGIPKNAISPGPKKVIVITANSDEQMLNFVNALGKAGAFKNNFVILNSCQTPITEKLVTSVVKEYGSQAVFAYQGLISASGVQDVVHGLVEKIKSKPKSNLVDTLRSLSTSARLNGIWIVCENFVHGLGSISNG